MGIGNLNRQARAIGCAGAIAALAIGVACGPSAHSSGNADSTAVAARRIPPQAPGSAKAPCPATGLWAECSVEKRLKSAGQVAKKVTGDTPARAGFSVKPAVYTLGRDSRLELFIYPSEAALAKEIAKMDTIRVAPVGGVASWPQAPTLIRSGNLAAVLLTRDAREADRLLLALTAGAPQPSR